MKVSLADEEKFLLEFEIEEGNRLAEAILHHNEDMTTAALDLAALLHQAYYEAKDEFRQPPHPWDPGTPNPPSID